MNIATMSQIDRLYRDNQILHAHLTAAQNEMMEAATEVTHAAQQLRLAEEERLIVQRDLAATEQTLNDTKAELETAKASLARTQRELEERTRQLGRSQAEMDEMRQRTNNLRQRLAGYRAAMYRFINDRMTTSSESESTGSSDSYAYHDPREQSESSDDSYEEDQNGANELHHGRPIRAEQ